MATVSDLIHSSMRLIGAIASGETLETFEQNDGLSTLNQIISSWNTEGLSLVGRQRQTQSVAGFNGPYALATRPVRIESASVSGSGIDSPLEIVDSVGWEAIPEKAMQSVYVRKLYCDYAYPNASVYIWPIPRLGGSLEMWTYIPIAQFTSLSQTINLPPGYEAAVRYNLAVELGPEYGRPLDPVVQGLAQQLKGSLVQLNALNHQRSPASSAAQANTMQPEPVS
jgi:hypothetical protein